MSKIKVTFDKKGFEALYRQLDNMEKWEAEAGYYGDDIHPPSGLSMAHLADIHEEGRDEQNIPARPFMTQTAHAIAASNISEEAYRNIIFNGKRTKDELKGMAKKMEDQISITIAYGNFEDNKPSTVAAKGFNAPLIETDHLMHNPKSDVVMKEGD